MAPGGVSWLGEFIRLFTRCPLVEAEVLRDHSDQVNHVSFSNNGKMFSTCSKDGFIRVNAQLGSFSSSPIPPPLPTSHEHDELQYISVTSGFTRLSMKTKYVCRGLISLYVNFHNNRTMWSTNLHVKICGWGGGEGKSCCQPFFGFNGSFALNPLTFQLFHFLSCLMCCYGLLHQVKV